MIRVTATFWQAYNLVSSRGITFFDTPDDETLSSIVRSILINEKGYDPSIIVEINGDGGDLALVVETNGTWELV